MYSIVEFVHWIGRMMNLFGLEESMGVIWGLILLKGRPITQKEIVKETGYSISSVSVSLSKLERLGFIATIGKRGRCRLYKASRTFLDGLENYLRRLIDVEIKNAVLHLSNEAAKIEDNLIRRNAESIISEYEKLRIFLLVFVEILNKHKNLEKEKLDETLFNIIK